MKDLHKDQYIQCPVLTSIILFLPIKIRLVTYISAQSNGVVEYTDWGRPWCNGYHHRKWTRRHEFKSWPRLITFHIALIPLGKV